MTATETLRAWFKGEKRPEVSAWITGDTVETRAILELADRLDKLELRGPNAEVQNWRRVTGADQRPPATESPPEPFRITRPGRYRMRNGGEVHIALADKRSTQPWHCADGKGSHGWWCSDGAYWEGEVSGSDIVAGPLNEPAPEALAGLNGFMVVYPEENDTTHIYDSYEKIQLRAGVHLDLSKVPTSAIVKPPEPVRETVRCRFWAYKSGVVICRRKAENSWPGHGDSDLVSHWEQEITFTHGEGLEGGT